jgi:hypothetical protein
MAPPICGKVQVKRGWRTYATMTIIAMRLRNPAMATGFHETILMNNPPELHRMALKSKERIALDLFSINYLRKEG